MRKGLEAFRRRQLWCLLVGTLGSAISGATSAGESPAGDSQPAGDTSGKSPNTLPALRLSLQLGESGRSVRGRRQKAPGAELADIAWVPLRLAPSIGLPPVAIAAAAMPPRASVAPVAVVDAHALPSGENRARSGIGEDDDTPQPPAPVPFDPTPQGTVTRRPEPAPAEPAAGATPKSRLPDLGAETWGMAPIRWGGSSTTTGTLLDDQGSRNTGIANSLNLNANSFIAAPYIATWSGNFGLNSNNNESTPDVGRAIKTESSGHTFGGNVSVFPQSPFPATAYFGYGTSEYTTNDNQKVPTRYTNFGIEQQYRTADNRDRYSARYDRSSFRSGNAEGNSSSMQANYSTRRSFEYEHFLEGEHSLNASLVYVPSSTDVSGQGGHQLNASISHAWTVYEDLSFSNQLSLVNSQTKQFQGNTLNTSDSNLFLGSSSFSWRPDEELPLSVGGGVSFGFTQVQNTADLGQTSSNFLAASVSASYRYSDQISMFAGAGMASTSSASGNNSAPGTASGSGNGRFTVANVNAGANYTGLPTQWNGFNYNWSMGGGVNGNMSTDGENSVGASATVGHSAMREYVIDERQAINFTVAQNFGYSVLPDSNAGTMTNSVGAGWRASYGDALSANLAASGGHSIDTEGNQSFSASLVGNGNYQISSRQSLTFGSNVNWTNSQRQDLPRQSLNEVVVDSDQSQVTGSVNIGYAHASPFSVRNLTYTADLLWVGNQSNQRLVGGSTVSSVYGYSTSLQQMLRYRVGRLSFNLSASVINAGGNSSAALFGSMTRNFDGFFDGRW